MKCKKALSFLLAMVMVLGLLPVSAMAAGTEEQLGSTTGGTYVDKTADPDKSYEYTVTGSDGSTQTVVVPAKGTEPTGNSVKPQDIPGEVYYQKVTDPANANGEGYLLVDTKTSQAVSTRPGIESVTIEGDHINGEHANAEWNVTKPGEGKLNFGVGNQSLTMEQIQKGAGTKKNPYTYSYNAVLGSKEGNNQQIYVSGETIKLSRTYYEPTRFWHVITDYPVDIYLKAVGTGVVTTKKKNSATSFTLFQKKTVSAGTQYVVDTTGLDALIAEAKTKDKALYEPDTWTPFEKALKAAEEAKTALTNPYATEQGAKDALVKIDKAHNDLKKAMDALKLLPAPETFTPVIDWQRTLEGQKDANGPLDTVQQGDLVTDITFNTPGYKTIDWDWNRIKSLTTDPSMTIWDYNTQKQYSAATRAEGVVAATWNEWEIKNKVAEWDDASVRKFAGTFIWPEGYTLSDKAAFASVNDANYQGIYDYVNGNAELKERFGDKKVIPVNDDMYVYVYKDGENPANWNAAEAAKHLVFWTGSSGKGLWTGGGTGDDWGRTTPPTYQDKAAVPAYRGIMPNMHDITGTESTDKYDGNFVSTYKLNHTDGWYTMVGTNTLMSTLNKLYPGEQLSGKMHIDIYAFDNSNNGGMDQLEIKFEKAPVTTAQVTVKYWLNDTTGTPLGTSVINGAKIGSTIKLSQGTADTELNHYKAAAITKANADVTDGKADYGNEGFVVKKTNNVINVVYTAKNLGEVTYYTYDFGVTNQYTYGDTGITKVTMETSDKGFSVASAKDGKAAFSYTPQDATGKPARAVLHLTKDGGEYDVNICVIPASNVLYEENFITGDWSKTNHTDMTVSDNGDNVYGHTAAYDGSTGANGEYTTAVTAEKRYSSDLTFKFNGIGLDLIGSCGPNYGTLMVKVKNGKDLVKAYVINTKYDGGEIHQVPLLHTNAKDLAAGVNYDVTVRGAYVVPTPVKGMSTMSANSAMPRDVYEALLDMGLTKNEIMTKVEFVNVADNLEKAPANGHVLMAEPAATGEQTVAVDGFRVYRSTEKAKVAYAENEQNLIYTNVMDEAITGNFHAYVEKNATTGEFTTKTYEGKGGPENELYLNPGTGIAFGTDATYAQVSLRAVNGATWANNSIELNHNTEMYYDVKVENGMITITNTGDQMLAIGNLKTNGKITTISDKALAVQAVAMMFAAPVEPEVFVPQTLTGKVSALPMGKYKMCTVNVKASTDVEKLTIDGKTVSPSNKLLVKLGLAKEYEFRMTKKVLRTEPAVFDVVAYDANGVASKPVQFSK